MRMKSCCFKVLVSLTIVIKLVVSDPQNAIVLSTRDTLWSIFLDHPFISWKIPLEGTQERPNFIMVDYDPTTEFLYLTNSRTVERFHLNTLEREILLQDQLAAYEGVAVDWLAQNVYFIDTKHARIKLLGLGNGGIMDIISTGIQRPRDIKVDPFEGYIFWTDWGKSVIERSFLDGTGRLVIVRDLRWPNGLAIDRVHKIIYWVDAGNGSIWMADYDGQSKKILMTIGGHLFSLTLEGDYIYWTDWKTHTVERVNRFTGQDREVLFNRVSSTLLGLVALTPNNPENGTNTCAVDNGGCNSFCLYRPPPQNKLCTSEYRKSDEGRDGMLLVGNHFALSQIPLDSSHFKDVRTIELEAGNSIFLDYHHGTRTIYFSTMSNPMSISRIKLNGSEQESVLSTAGLSPEGIAIDWIAKNLYWVVPRERKISVAKLNGSSPMDIVTGLARPRAICLDPADGYIYWTDWGQPAIEKSFLDGTGRQAIVVENLGYPNGITIDLVEKMLYWGDAKLDRIETCGLDGSNRKVIVSENVPHVFGIAILGDDLFWSDWLTRKIEMVNKRTGGDRKDIHEYSRQPMGLKAVDLNNPPRGNNTCGINNGGCSHLCLYRPSPLTHVCVSPEGNVLLPNAQGVSGTISISIGNDEYDRNTSALNGRGIGLNRTVNESDMSLDYNTTGFNRSDVKSNISDISFDRFDKEFNTSTTGFNRTTESLCTADVFNRTTVVFNTTSLSFNRTNERFNKSTNSFHKTNATLNTTSERSNNNISFDKSGIILFNRTEAGFNKTDADFNTTQVNFNKADAGLNRTYAVFNKTDAGFNRTNADFNRTKSGFNWTDAAFNRTDVDFNRPEAGFNRTEGGFNRTNANFNRTEAGFSRSGTAFNKTEAYFNTIDGDFNSTEAGFNRTDAVSNRSHTSNNTMPTEKYPWSTDEPPACPCDWPETSDFLIDNFCRLDTHIVMRATVKQIHKTDHDLILDLRKRKNLFKTINALRIQKETEALKVFIKDRDSCTCDEIIQRRKKYLLMGKMEAGEFLVSYIMPTSSEAYRKSVRSIRKKDACIFHSWSKIHDELADVVKVDL